MAYKGGRTLFAISIGCILAAATFAVAHMIDQSRDADAVKKARADLKRQEDLARKAGIPLTESELITPIPASENAAVLYVQAGELEKQVSKFKVIDDALLLSSISDQASEATAQSGLKAAKPMMDVVAEAAKRPGFMFEKQSLPSPLDFPTFSQFKLYAKIATLEARLLTYEGKPIAALDCIRTYAPITKHLGQSPSDLAVLVQCAVDAIFSKQIGEILAKHGQEPGVAKAAQSALLMMGTSPNLVRFAEGENVYTLTVTFDEINPKNGEKPNASGMDDPDFKRVVRLAPKPGMIEEWRARQIEYTRNLVGIYQQPKANWTQVSKNADDMMNKMLSASDDSVAFLRLMSVLKQSAFLDAIARQLSTQRVLAQAAAVLESWSTSGKIPEALPLPGEAALDPRSNGNLHYTHTATGFKIYGVGDHGVDHGGKPRGAGSPSETDVVFEYPANRAESEK